MDAVLLACTSALLFGGMTVALRHPLARGVDPVAGALHTVVPAILVTLPFVAATGVDLEGLWPFVVAGLLAPGVSQLLFTFAIRDAGPSRTSVVVGTAPLFAVAIALVVLEEPLEVALVSGALLIVLGGILLASERSRPGHVKIAGLVAALAATVVFASRDNLVRWLADDSDTTVQPALAAATTLTAGMLVVAASLLVRGGPLRVRDLPSFVPAGICFGLSYVCLFEAYYRGPVSVVSPLVATESLWGVTLSAVFLRRHELVGPRLIAGAVLVVLGGALIGAAR